MERRRQGTAGSNEGRVQEEGESMKNQLYIRLHDGDTGTCKDVSLLITKYGATFLDEDENEIFGVQYTSEFNRMEVLRWDSRGRADGSLYWEADR